MKTFNYPDGTPCSVCGKELTVENWSRQRNRKCRNCHNALGREYYRKNREHILSRMRDRDPERRWDYNLRRWYGITAVEYYAMLNEQKGGCAICGSTDPRGKRLQKFHVDHCHKSGRVRGILCGPCNFLIGAAKEDPKILEAAVAYLGKS